MKEHSKRWPCTEGHKNLLLYEDPDWVTNAVVRTPGRDGRIHDHAHSWTAYGVLDGMERLERYRRVDGGERRVCADRARSLGPRVTPARSISCHLLRFIPKRADPARSVGVIVRSERLVGKTLQGRYDAKTNEYNQSEGPTQVPFEVA